MAKKKRARKQEEDADFEVSFAETFESDTVRAVVGVFLSAIALFLILAAFNVGGAVGAATYKGLSFLVGIGYTLLPLSLLISAYIFLQSFQGRSFKVAKIISTIVFLIAGLGLVDIAFPSKGGVVGALISKPLITAFDTIASVIFLIAFVIASLIISFEVHPVALFARIKEFLFPPLSFEAIENEPVVEVTTEVEDVEEETKEEPGTEEDEKPEAPKKRGRGFFSAPAEEETEVPIISASGAIYAPPPLSLLSKNKGKPEVGDVKANANIIKRTMQNFSIDVEMDEVSIGPTVTRYALKPAEGVRLAKIVALQSNLELALAASPVRIEAPIPGKSLVGIEVPNTSRTTIGMAPMVSDIQYTQTDKPLMVALGRDITGRAMFADIAKMPHVLIAGTTGSGKSVMMHDIVMSLLYRCGPEQLRFVMVDPKRVELTLYNSIPHLLTPVITDPKRAILALKWLAKEMDRRYNILETEKVRDIASYHKNILAPALENRTGEEGEQLPEAMPYIVVIIDELADIMQMFPRELEAGIVRLAQMSRAVGIHLVLATQRPSVKVVTGLIKANIPARLAFQVASQVDSKTILDGVGAEKLLGAGDMLFLSGEMSKPSRLQSPFVSESEVKSVVSWIKKHYEHILTDEIDFSEGKVGSEGGIFAGSLADSDEDDDLYDEARDAVMEAGKASTSYLQRKLRIGYSRAARLMDILEERGVIGPADGSKPREIIADNGDEEDTSDDNNDDVLSEDAGEEERV